MTKKENNILTTIGFIKEVDKQLKNFPTNQAAFKAVNTEHKKKFGFVKYANFNSFRNVKNKKMNSN